MRKPTYILGIESSCDDTSAAVIKDNILLSNVIANQQIHEQYGGVVPELASREHQKNILPVIDAAVKKAGITKKDLSAIAYTNGPGLLGSLLVGTSFAKGLSIGLNIPLIEVNHMKAHILAHFIKLNEDSSESPNFPFLCLTVSGGHTQLVKVNSSDSMEILGQTIDDAAGEAFDKIAKIIGLPYPGGPLIDKLAKEGNENAIKFAIPKAPELNYSFSGLKTSVLYYLKKQLADDPNYIEENKADICASAQKAILDNLFIKLNKAITQTGVKSIAIAGGVSANSGLRKRLIKMSEQNDYKVFIPEFQFCTDNAAMIAISGLFEYEKGNFSTLSTKPKARLAI